MEKILTLFLLFILCGCNKKEIITQDKELAQLLSENEYIIVDVRTKDEYLTGHIVDSINIPYDKISENELDKDKLILVYCMSGTRSKIAFDALTNLGYNVHDLGAFSEIDLPKE